MHQKVEMQSDLTILTLGTTMTKFVDSIIVQKHEKSGQLLIDDKLRLITSDKVENVYALGDCSYIQNQAVRIQSTAQVAMQQALTVAANIGISCKQSDKKRITSIDKNKLLKKFRYLNLGEIVSFGTTSASVYAISGWIRIKGRMAALIRVLLYSIRMPIYSQRLLCIKKVFKVTLEKVINYIQNCFMSKNIQKRML